MIDCPMMLLSHLDLQKVAFGFIQKLRHDFRPLVQDIHKVVFLYHQQIGGSGGRGRFAGKKKKKRG